MKQKILLFALLISFSAIYAQKTGDVTIYSNTGKKFFVILNGIRQNTEAETNVHVSGLQNSWYSCRVLAEDKSFDIEKNIGIKKDSLITYRITNKKKKYKLRYYSETKIKDAMPDNPNQISVAYHSTETPNGSVNVNTTSNQSTTTSTSTTTTTNTNNQQVENGSISINMDINGNGTVQTENQNGSENISINIEMTGMDANTGISHGTGAGGGTGGGERDGQGKKNGLNTTQSTITTHGSGNGSGTGGGNGNGQGGKKGINKTESITSTTTTTTTTSSTTTVNGTVTNTDQTTTIVESTEGNLYTDDDMTMTISSGGGCATSATDMEEIKTAITNENFADDQLNMAKMATKNKCLNVDQIKEISALFSFSDAKLSFIKSAYLNCLNQSDYYQLMNTLTFADDKEELKKYIESK